MKEKTTVFHNGLAVEVEIYSAPATPPSYASGGSPPEWDMEILSVSIDDAEELSEWLGAEEGEVEKLSTKDLESLADDWWDEIAESLD